MYLYNIELWLRNMSTPLFFFYISSVMNRTIILLILLYSNKEPFSKFLWKY